MEETNVVLDAVAAQCEAIEHSYGVAKKKRKTVVDALRLAIVECEDSISSATTPEDGSEGKLRILREKVQDLRPYKQINKFHKKLHANISSLRKTLEKVSSRSTKEVTDRSIAFERTEDGIFERIIADELRRTQQADAADFIASDIVEMSEIRKYETLSRLTDAVRRRDLPLLLAWASENQIAEELKFHLLALEFERIVRESSAAEAVRFARSDMRAFCIKYPRKMQRLMAALLFVGEEEKIAEDGDEMSKWSVVEREVRRDVCRLVGLPTKSPLQTTVEAALSAMPTLLKYRKVMSTRERSDDDSKSVAHAELPVLALPKDLQFHSVFVCPVSREQTTQENPPVLLKCGHAISECAMKRLCETQYWPSRNNRATPAHSRRKFKCPYCGVEQSTEDSLQLIF